MSLFIDCDFWVDLGDFERFFVPVQADITGRKIAQNNPDPPRNHNLNFQLIGVPVVQYSCYSHSLALHSSVSHVPDVIMFQVGDVRVRFSFAGFTGKPGSKLGDPIKVCSVCHKLEKGVK